MTALARPVAALIVPDGEIPHSELLARGQACAVALRRQGLRPGDLVICPVGGGTPALSLMQRALALNKAALMPVADGLTPGEAHGLAGQTGADWVWEPAGQSDTEAEGIVGQGRLRAVKPPRGGKVMRDDELALVVQTSGSSGGCKAAMLSASALHASCERINQRLRLAAGDLWLCALPRQHIGGLVISYRCAMAGAGMLLHPGFDASRIARDLWRHPVTHLSLVPAMLARLLDQCPRPPEWLRVVLMGGQALDPALARRALDSGWPLHLGYGMTETCSFIASRALGNAGEPTQVERTGDVEERIDVGNRHGFARDGNGEQALWSLPPIRRDPSADRLLVGEQRTDEQRTDEQRTGEQRVEESSASSRTMLRPLPDVWLEAPVCTRADRPTPLRLRGPMLMMGYANPRRAPGLGLEADGWLQTADLACLTPMVPATPDDESMRFRVTPMVPATPDDESMRFRVTPMVPTTRGNEPMRRAFGDAFGLHVLGRADDQLVIGGVNVQPGIIEAQISACDGVSRCVLVGLPEPVWGHVLVALYQGEIPAEALDGWCRAHLPSPRRPRLFLPLRHWPALPSGKDDRVRLREIAADAWHGRAQSSRSVEISDSAGGHEKIPSRDMENHRG